MKIIFISDLHGYTPEIPECDICCFVGDYQKRDTRWENESYFLDLKRRCVTIGIAGNHDEHLEQSSELGKRMFTHYLLDQSVEVEGIKFFGTPYTLLTDYPFGKTEEQLELLYSRILCDFVIDDNFPNILMSHQPAYGLLDRSLPNSFGPSENCGSKSLLNFVMNVQPKIHCSGHIHESYGCIVTPATKTRSAITHLNVSYCDAAYRPRNKIVEYDTETGRIDEYFTS